MNTVKMPARQVRDGLGSVITRAVSGGRTIVLSHGRPMAVIVGLIEAERLGLISHKSDEAEQAQRGGGQ